MTKLRLGQIDTSDISSSVFASANAVNTVQDNVTSLTATAAANDYNSFTTLTANIYNTYTSLSANIDSVQANVYALTLDTVATNGNSTTVSIEVAGLSSSGNLLVSGPTTLNSNVTINGMIDSVDRIQFNTSIDTDATAGILAWSADAGTLQYGLNDVTKVRIGEDSFYFVKAGEALSRGNVVYASGAVGNSGNIEVSKYAANNTVLEQYVVGIMADDVASGEFGYAVVIGTVRGLVADGSTIGETWNLGDVLYPSPTNPGGLTKIEPEAPNQSIPIAFITSNSSSNGSVALRVTSLGSRLGGLHNVQTGTESDGDVLTYVSANSRWEPKSVSADESNLYNTYTTVTGLINTVQDNVTSLTSTVDNIDANIYNSYTTLTANIYNTFAYLDANVGGGGDASNAWVNANDYNTYTTLVGFINTIQDNVGSGGGAVASGNAVLFSDFFTIDGSTNAFTLSSNAVQEGAYLLVYLDGLLQHNDAYVVSNTTLTLSNTDPLTTSSLGVRALTGAVGATTTSNNIIDFLLVAGGGSGGGAAATSCGAGGGAGGLIYETSYPITIGVTYDIVIGAGGAVTSAAQVDGNPGANSSAFGLTAIGGGYGATYGQPGGDGGSGGGGAGRDLYTTSAFGGDGVAEQGHRGGNAARGSGTTDDSGGGGGGAAGPGVSAKDLVGGEGGTGFACTIEGLTTTTYYAGGGGGGTEDGVVGAAGGFGGGGDGGYNGGSRRGADVNTGGGGGGASGSSTLSGAEGASGVVVIRTLLTAASTTGSPTTSTVGSYNIYKFTGSGSITF